MSGFIILAAGIAATVIAITPLPAWLVLMWAQWRRSRHERH